MSVSDLILALGLLLAVEGLLYAAFPGLMRRAIAQALLMPPDALRIGGLIAAIIGVGLVWFVRGG
ncbi:MAG: DUF2065 domain-containing protein [Alphaproteobacteria bacterium]|nr:DUF2065 domain-containing protein [Alphaproteobacteria bacterium]